jgi:predicted methyltransferase
MRHIRGGSTLVRLFGIGLAFTGLVRATAQEHSVRPGINRPYEAAPVYEQWRSVFERSGREIYDRRHEIVAAMALQPGVVVADIGAGTGLFTRLFAPRVQPGGRVLAIDISREFTANVLRTAREQGLDNVEGRVSSPTDTGLPPDSIDVAFVCDTYHHFEYPYKMLRSIHTALRPSGTLVVIDFRRIPGLSSPWVMEHVRAGKDAVTGEIESSGFMLVEEIDLLRSNFFLRFQKAKAN